MRFNGYIKPAEMLLHCAGTAPTHEFFLKSHLGLILRHDDRCTQVNRDEAQLGSEQSEFRQSSREECDCTLKDG